MTDKFLIVGNWKSHNVSTTNWLMQGQVDPDIEVVIAAPYTMLFLLAAGEFLLGAQDVSMFPPGAYTGETPGELLRELDVVYCLIGHSERRKYLGETTEMVEKKMERLLECGIKPIVCAQNFDEIPELAKNTPGNKYVVMFEPFEAISKDGKSNAVGADKVHEVINEWKGKLPSGVKFLYGGSVTAQNVDTYKNFVSGFVVGHASLEPEEFFNIVKQCSLQTDS